MGHKNRDNKHTPRPSDLLGKTAVADEEEEEEATEATPILEVKVEATAPPAPPPAPKPVTTLEQIVESMPEDTPQQKLDKQKAKEELAKLQSFTKSSQEKNKFAAFDAALRNLETGVAKWLDDLAKTHGVSLEGRKITVAYPKTEEEKKLPDITNIPKGARTGSGNGKGNGNAFKSNGKVIAYMPDGRQENYDSLHAFALTKGIKYNGRPTARVAVEDPWETEKDASGNYPKMPFRHTITDGEAGVLVVKRVAR